MNSVTLLNHKAHCGPLRSAPNHRSFSPRTYPLLRRNLVVRAASDADKEKKNRELVTEIEESLKKSGMDSKAANEVLKRWKDEVGHDISDADLRKVLVGQSSKVIGLVLFSTLLDIGAAYGSVTAGNFLAVALAEQGNGLPSFAISAISWIIAGYYASGAIFDAFKLVTLIIAAFTFNVNAGAFLEAVEDIAGSTGLNALDKAVEAVNSVKVFQAINKMSDLLKESNKSSASSSDMLADLGAYLTLDKAIKNYGFEAANYGLTDAQAAQIATVFSKYDVNDDGVLSKDEFGRLCAKFAPDLKDAEVAAAYSALDLNKDGSISFDEFVKWWLKDMAPVTA